MLLRFRFANFRSFRDEAEISFIAVYGKDRPGAIRIEDLGVNVLRVAGIYGANASGKSNVLEALRFARSAVLSSHQTWKPDDPIKVQPFLLDSDSRKAPSTFELEFLVSGVLFIYGFVAGADRVRREWLYSFPNQRRQVWFVRDSVKPVEYLFGKRLGGQNRRIAGLTRANSLFLSAAAANGHEQLTPIYTWFSSGIAHAMGNESNDLLQITMEEIEDSEKKSRVLRLLQAADSGLVELVSSWRPFDQGTNEFLMAFLDFAKEKGMVQDLPGQDTELKFPEVLLKHQAKDGVYDLPLHLESRGTTNLLRMAGLLIRSLDRGSLLLFDELDSSLHPHLVREIVRLFVDEASNPRGAQLLFNTHDTSLLGHVANSSPLERDQVWLVEKDQEGASHLYPLTDFKARKDENLERGYLQGRYGGVPFVEGVFRE